MSVVIVTPSGIFKKVPPPPQQGEQALIFLQFFTDRNSLQM